MSSSNSRYHQGIYIPNFERIELLPPINNILRTIPIRQLVSPSKIRQIKHKTTLSKLASTCDMFKGKGKAVPSSNDWWPPHSPEGHFSNLPTEVSRIKDHLTRAEAAKYYPNGFPQGWDSPKDLAAQAKAAERMVADLTKEKSINRSRSLSRQKKTRLDSYMEAILEEPPATPRLQHALPVPVPNQGWPLVLPPLRQDTRPATPKPKHDQVVPPGALPTPSYLVEQDTPPHTPTCKPRKPRVVHKQPSPREKKGSPLKQSWIRAGSDNPSGENQLG
jgi:hypothetical protein